MLFSSVGILLIGLDDLLFDALWLAPRPRDPSPVPSAPPIDGRFAVFVHAWDEAEGFRSEECRAGKECVSTCRSRWLSYHLKKTKHISTGTPDSHVCSPSH